MEALKERQYYQRWDKSFRITLLLNKYPFLNSAIRVLLSGFCRLLRMIYSSKKKTGVITIINLHRLGDTVFTVPAIEQIYKWYLNYRIFIFCFEESRDILALRFDENDLITVNKQDFYFYRRIANSRIRRKVKSTNAEIIFDLTGMPASSTMIFNSSANNIIGMNYRYLKGLYNQFVDIRSEPDFMDMYLDVIKLVIPPEYLVHKTDIKTFPINFSKNSKIVVHPFAIRKPKEWSLRKYIDLAYDLSFDYEVEIISPPGFIPEDIVFEIKKLRIPITETPSVKDLINKIKECALFISNDSGPTFIADLLGKATFTIYGPTNPNYSHPKGMHHKYYVRKLNCSATSERFCFTLAGVYCPSNECLELITFETIRDQVRLFLIHLKLPRKGVS